MPSAGAVCPPQITPMRKPMSGLPLNHVDTTTYVELTTETPDCRIFFTTDGTKPSPLRRKVAGREITFKYIAPFSLKAGKRTLKAIAVSRDGLKESDVVTRAMTVEDMGLISTDTESQSTVCFEPDAQRKKSPAKSNKMKNRKNSPLRASYNQPPIPGPAKEAWGAASTPQEMNSNYPDNGAAYDGSSPEGPCNPTNYAGTQINLWGSSTPGPNMNVSPSGTVTFGNGMGAQPISTQYGFLTEQMIQNCRPVNKSLTVEELRAVLAESRQELSPPPPQPAIEYPVNKDPPLNGVSPGNGNWKEQILHIYAHLLENAKQNPDFKSDIAQPQMGKMLSATLEDEGDGYKISLVMAKPGVPRGSIRKPVKVKSEPVKKWPVKEAVIIKKSKPAAKEPPKEPPKPEKPKPKPKSDPYYEMETENLNTEGTLKMYDKFNADVDCEVLKKAMSGLGTDEETIINVMAYRANPQRCEIVKTYKALFGKNLIDEFKSELSGNFLEVIKWLCYSPSEFDAQQLRSAMKGLGTDDDCLIEILCTRSNAQIKEIINTYKEKFNRDLEKDIISDTSGNFKRLLVSLVQANRSDSNEVDRNKARQDAKALHEAGEKKWGTDESKFNQILASRSYPHLRAVFEEYGKISKKDIQDVLKSELSGDILSGMLTIVRCVRNKAAHFARQLQKTMKGIGTDDDTLIRISISRCELDMVQIKEEFQTLTGQALEKFVADDTTGDYRSTILALVTGGPAPDMAVKSGKGFVAATRAKTDEQLDEEVKMESEKMKEEPTVTPHENFNAEQDAEVLRKAMKGFGTDEDAIINVLAYRSNAQRMDIVKTFKTMFGKDLKAELKSELSGGVKDLAVGLCLAPAEFDATMIKKAVKGLGTDEEVLVEVICTRSNQQIKDFSAAYKTLFNKNVEDDVASDTSGHFKRLLVSLLGGTRDESKEFDRNKARQDAQAMYDAGEKKWGTDESRFNAILVSRSFAQLRATFQEYAKISKNDIEDAIKKEMSSDLKDGMLAIVRCIRSKPTHFATELYTSMKGLGTKDDTLIRILVSRCEVDMVQIKEDFQKQYKQTLGMFIADDLSGDYKTLALAVIRDETAGKKKKGKR